MTMTVIATKKGVSPVGSCAPGQSDERLYIECRISLRPSFRSRGQLEDRQHKLLRGPGLELPSTLFVGLVPGLFPSGKDLHRQHQYRGAPSSLGVLRKLNHGISDGS
jgi:hypothetical protein